MTDRKCTSGDGGGLFSFHLFRFICESDLR